MRSSMYVAAGMSDVGCEMCMYGIFIYTIGCQKYMDGILYRCCCQYERVRVSNIPYLYIYDRAAEMYACIAIAATMSEIECEMQMHA